MMCEDCWPLATATTPQPVHLTSSVRLISTIRLLLETLRVIRLSWIVGPISRAACQDKLYSTVAQSLSQAVGMEC